MNHDYSHCSDCNDACPKDCFRAMLVRDLHGRPGLPVSWSALRGIKECPLTDTVTDAGRTRSQNAQTSQKED